MKNFTKQIILSAIMLLVLANVGWGQTVFTDDFSTNTSATYTTSGAIGSSAFSITRSGADWGGRRNTSPAQLELTNDASATANVAGWVFANTLTSSFSSPYNTTLSSNSGLVSWYFNMRQIRTDPAGFSSGSYGVAFILAGSSTSVNNTGNGYAVVLGQSGSTDPIRLVKYNNGLSGTLTNIITSNTSGLTDFGTEYLSIKITYNPSNNQWELFLRNDGASAFTDPSTGTLTSQGTATDNAYTGVSLDNAGGYWQGSTGANLSAFFDNFIVNVAPSVSTPSVTTTAASLILSTGATFNGNITSDGGSSITERGFCYKTSSGVLITDNKTSEGGTSTGTYSKSFTLSPETNYFYKAYASNTIGTTLSSTEINFWTLSTVPSAHSSSFISSVISQTQIDLTFSAASTITNADGYIILQKTGSAPTGLPTDANAYTVGNTIGDGTVAAIITSTSATTTNISGLTASTQYYFTILPYNYNGSNNETYNYKTDGVIPVVNATTSAPNDVDSYVSTPMVQANPLTISSLYDTDLEAIEVFKFNIIDVGTDGLETKVTQIKISAGAGNTTNWANTIQGVKLSLDGGSSFVTIGTSVITANSITIPITIGNLDLANGSSNEVSLFVYLKNSGLTDNQVIQFTIPKVSHEFMADATGSTFATDFPDVINSNQMTVDVAATKLRFAQQPTNTFINQIMAPSVTIQATDANNNIDANKTGTVSLSSTGTMTGSVTATLSTGFGTFSDITHTAAGTGLTLTATLSPLTDITSSAFDISLVPTLTEVFLPQYIQGKTTSSNDNRTPFAYMVTLSNLKPSVTYRYYNSVVIPSDGTTGNGAGNVIYVTNVGSFYRSTNAGLSTAGTYGTFTTDINGSYTGWFITEPTANATRFLPGTDVNMRILLNDGADGTSVVTRLTTTNTVRVINYGGNTTDGTGIRGGSFANPKNFVFLYDNELGTGRPLSGTYIESDGVDNTTANNYVSFYSTSVNNVSGAWGTIIPNDLATGVRRIEQRSLINTPSLNPGDLVNFETSPDGIWGSTNTVNPIAGTTALVLNDAPLPVQLSSFNSSSIGRDIRVNWVTALETNNSGFEVERVQSSELRVQSWEKIGYVQGHGTVNTPTNYSFEDKNLQTGKYKYRLKQIDHNGNYEYFELNGEVEIGVPKKYDLSQNYPNPFNPVTKINYDLPVDSKVTMLVYDITGREVARLLNGEFKKAGFHTTDFNASSLSSGVYFYSLSTDAYRMTKKMVVVK